MKLICEGVEQNADSAEKLGIKLRTAKIQMVNIYRKVGVNSKLAVVLKFADAPSQDRASYLAAAV